MKLVEKTIGIFAEFINGIKDMNKPKSEEEKILESLKEAQREMKSKEEYFDFARDPDLVDFAIYDMEASKKKYSYLLKKLKKENNV